MFRLNNAVKTGDAKTVGAVSVLFVPGKHVTTVEAVTVSNIAMVGMVGHVVCAPFCVARP